VLKRVLRRGEREKSPLADQMQGVGYRHSKKRKVTLIGGRGASLLKGSKHLE